jgi:hypothetical protein
MKTEVYSWRVSADLKIDLEREARKRNISLSAAIDTAAREWLARSSAENGGDQEEQRRLHAAASKCFGTFAGADPHRSERAREILQQRLRRRHGR